MKTYVVDAGTKVVLKYLKYHGIYASLRHYEKLLFTSDELKGYEICPTKSLVFVRNMVEWYIPENSVRILN